MKKLLTLLLLSATSALYAQKNDCNTSSFTIDGEIQSTITIDAKAIAGYTSVAIPDLTITNHKGEYKNKFSGLKGVPLKEILGKAAITSQSPKTLSEYYFVFTACDGYKVVYSWNEIFNTETGNHIFVITEKDGAKGSQIKEGIITITASDEKTGRRYVKGLQTITIFKAK